MGNRARLLFFVTSFFGSFAWGGDARASESAISVGKMNEICSAYYPLNPKEAPMPVANPVPNLSYRRYDSVVGGLKEVTAGLSETSKNKAGP